MKKLVVLFVVVSILFGGIVGFPGVSSARGASEKAMENASDEAVFHKVGDWFATRGKTDTEKQTIITERKGKRAAAKARKTAAKAQKVAEKQMRKSKSDAKRMMKGSKK